MTAIAGLRGTSTSDWATDERPKNFRETILWRDPNGMAPLTALMARMKTETVDDPEFSWYEEELAPARLQINGAVNSNSSSTLITVFTSGDFTASDLVMGDLLLYEGTTSTGVHWEIVELSTTPAASNVMTVTRAVASTQINTMLTAGWLVKVGSAFAEGSTAPDAVGRKPTKYTNYTEIFRTSYKISNTAKATRYRTGDPLKNEKKRRMFDHAAALEHAFLFGSRYETTGTVGGKSMPKRYTGGVFQFLRDNYDAVSKPTIKLITSTLTQEDFLDATYPMFDYGFTGAGNERIALCGNGFLNRMNKVILGDGQTRINYDGQIKVFGMNLEKWILPQGTVYLKSHPMMNVNRKFKNSAFFINPSGITYRPLRGRDTKAFDNIQPNDADYTAGEWLTEAGVELHHMRSMLYMEITDN